MHSVPVHLDQTRSCAAGGSRRRLAKGFTAILACWRLCRSRAAERRALGQLSDAGLRDIGLSRSQAEDECRKWSWYP